MNVSDINLCYFNVFQVLDHYVLKLSPTSGHLTTDRAMRGRYNLVAEQATPIRSWDKTAWSPWSASVADDDLE